MTTKTITNTRPTIISSQSFAYGRTRFQMSIVNIVLLELNIDVSDDIRAAIITANIRPRAPLGINLMTSNGYAMFEHPDGLPHILLHVSGSAQPISSLKI
jgi:hypothetical protein